MAQQFDSRTKSGSVTAEMREVQDAVETWIAIDDGSQKRPEKLLGATVIELTKAEALVVQAKAMSWHVEKHCEDSSIDDVTKGGERFAAMVLEEAETLKTQMRDAFDVKHIGWAFRQF